MPRLYRQIRVACAISALSFAAGLLVRLYGGLLIRDLQARRKKRTLRARLRRVEREQRRILEEIRRLEETG